MKSDEVKKMHELEINNWWFVGRRKIISDFINDTFGLDSNVKILDVGCGSGFTTKHLKQIGDVYGIDQSTYGIKTCYEQGLNKTVQGNLENIPFKEEAFDIITMFDVLEHIEDDSTMLKRLISLLKHDGKLYITVPAYQFLWTEHDVALSHFRRYSIKSLKKLFSETDYKIFKISYYMTILFPLICIYKIFFRFSASEKKSETHSQNVPKIINKCFIKFLSFESKILKKIPLRFGASIICCISKK